MSLWRRLADRVLPDSALAGIGKVEWRIEEKAAVGVRTMVAPVTVSLDLLRHDPFRWMSQRGTVWRRWPIGSFDEQLLAAMRQIGMPPLRGPQDVVVGLEPTTTSDQLSGEHDIHA